MKKEKFKYYQDLIQLWLFKAVLVFSVFSFTGINLQIVAAANVAVKTELTESRIRKAEFDLKKHSKNLFKRKLSDERTFNIWTVLNYYNVVISQYKSYLNRNLLYSITSKNLLIKILPSFSDDENLLSLT